MVGLGFLPGDSISSASIVSRDGSAIAGKSGSTSDHQAFLWTPTTGMIGLGKLPGKFLTSFAFGVSSNGSVVVGSTGSGSGIEAFRWTKSDGMVGLGYLPGGNKYSCASAIASDGSVIVGQCALRPENNEAFVWDSTTGMRPIKSVLKKDFGLVLAEWKLTDATCISGDGKTIAGTGKHNGHEEAWIAHLDRPLNTPTGKEPKK